MIKTLKILMPDILTSIDDDEFVGLAVSLERPIAPLSITYGVNWKRDGF